VKYFIKKSPHSDCFEVAAHTERVRARWREKLLNELLLPYRKKAKAVLGCRENCTRAKTPLEPTKCWEYKSKQIMAAQQVGHLPRTS
jgi:hypothetical protein